MLEQERVKLIARVVQDMAILYGDLIMWVIYDKPNDFPDKFVVRPHSAKLEAPMSFFMTGDSLDDIKKLLPPGLSLLPRDETDAECVVETWL